MFSFHSSGDRVGKAKMMEIDRCNITYSKIRHSPHSHKHFFIRTFMHLHYTLQSHCTENSKQIFPEMKLQQNGHSDRGDLKIAHRYVTKAAQFNFWEYISDFLCSVPTFLLRTEVSTTVKQKETIFCITVQSLYH